MKTLCKVSFIICAAAIVTGCAVSEGSTARNAVAAMTTTAGAGLPQPTVGFKAADQLKHPPEKVYAAALAALDAMRVPVLNSNQAEGRITTDYAAGPRSSTAFGLLGSNSSRYKYSVNIRGVGRDSKLAVTAFIESSGNSIQAWRDVSADNLTATGNIRDALVENIEKNLK